MRLGEVGLLTPNVKRLADFYRQLLNVKDRDKDEVHQTILTQETMLTITKDDHAVAVPHPSIVLAFTVSDIQSAHQRLLQLGVTIIEGPVLRPWGAINLSFYDPDGNIIYLREFTK